jgi:NAD(P)-dependent dehydrogenase (short-subunit alcohol dehydrogenase family)
MASSKEIILITGGNTGIGLELVKALYKSNTAYEIVIGSRDPKKGEDAIAKVKAEVTESPSTLSVIQVDISSDSSILKARDDIQSSFGQLNVLVNNAGASFDQNIKSGKMTTREAWNASWDTNVAGTQVITEEFVPLLLKASKPRILFVTSGTSTLTETEQTHNDTLKRINASPPAGWPKENTFPVAAYRSSKTGLNMCMREWHKMLGNDGVKVWGISPGFLATGLGDVGAEQLKKVCSFEMKTFLSIANCVHRWALEILLWAVNS